ncbi:hypothetical protein HMPREF9123_0293 [Neisseria bacilliformis ATCC BAA-1200]|uniref:Uncharacterized protein n=1 Tax=Neisseria bacilliformis ATCC BAA-1200 TaxID=888742 RepID=F2B948_9NEIS|nr:hypothetical protein HMPREF9123_0293 [Neisseria bacilliformis ATCC BAA-1200]
MLAAEMEFVLHDAAFGFSDGLCTVFGKKQPENGFSGCFCVGFTAPLRL